MIAAAGVLATGASTPRGVPARLRGIDPDEVRDVACEITAATDVCDPAAPTPSEPTFGPSGGTGAGGFGGVVGWLLVIALVVALVAVLAWLATVWLATRRAAADDGADDADDEADADEAIDGIAAERVIDLERPPDRWRRLAAEHRAEGRHRDAIRCEYRALVGDLARAGLVDEIPGRTSGEERAQVRALAPSSAGEFDAAADLFDIAWFGDADVDAADDEVFVHRSQRVLADAEGGRRR